MGAPIRVVYQVEDDILFVLRDGALSETWNLTVNGRWTIRISQDAREGVGYVIANASQEVPQIVQAIQRGDCADLVERHFEQRLEALNGRLEVAQRRTCEVEARNFEKVSEARDLQTCTR